MKYPIGQEPLISESEATVLSIVGYLLNIYVYP